MKKHPRPHEAPNTGAESVPPGATRKAFDRPENPSDGTPGSAAGPRHASGDIGHGIELNDDANSHHEDLPIEVGQDDETDDATAYGGISGGAVGGTPAGQRASGGNIHRGIEPGGTHRGDSTIGADPQKG